MNYLDRFRDIDINLVKGMFAEIITFRQAVKIMEVCGTHTRAIFESGLRELLPENITLISGPGCPICVTPQIYIDTAIELARRRDVIIVTFADLFRVPGSRTSLQQLKGSSSDIRVISTPLEAVKIAVKNIDQEIVFLAVGFETTAPVIALSVLEAVKLKLSNYSLLVSLKTMPAVIKRLISDKDLAVDGFICPGHVSTIIGSQPFNFIADEYNLPAVIAGFERVDIIRALAKILKMIKDSNLKVENLYNRVVKTEGNLKAKSIINEVFEPVDNTWRGLAEIANSGLGLREKYRDFNAEKRFVLKSTPQRQVSNCICGDILKGKKTPYDCQLFAKNCNPLNPQGPCMVSEEGNCHIYYEYRR
ncbi:MAG: hydrogenase formation protein HypD [Firmicutes bacterium]|nr:hydrogenase formation protein HypD [Bacillota bacterium]